MAQYEEVLNTILPDYALLQAANGSVDRDAFYLAHTASDIERLAAEGVTSNHIYANIHDLKESQLRDVLGSCRLLAGSLEELNLLDRIAQVKNDAGQLTTVGLRLVPTTYDSGQPGIREAELPHLAQERRRLSALSMQGCFVQDCTKGLYGKDLGRYLRNCYELAKRMTVILPCSMPYLGIVGAVGAVIRNAQEQPETLPEVQRAAEIVAMQNRTAFYARLLIT
jgi:hypothetical protein